MSRLFLILLTAVFGVALLFGLAQAIDPAIADLNIYAGSDYRLLLTLKDSTGKPLDLRGYSYKAQFRQAPAPTGILYATYSTAFTNISGGGLALKLSRAQTTTNSGKSGIWDLQQTDSGGMIDYILTGKVAVKPTATR